MSENSENLDNTTENSTGKPEIEMTRRGAKFIGVLNNLSNEEKAERMARWEADRERARAQHQTIAVIPDDGDESDKPNRRERRDANGGYVKRRDIIALNKTILRKFITEGKWAEFSVKINEYHAELEEISKTLQKEGKRCTGCALNPYRAKYAEMLGADFRDPEVITDEEMIPIKQELNVSSIQVGIENGQVLIR